MFSDKIHVRDSEEDRSAEVDFACEFKELSGFDWPPANATVWTIVLTRAGFSEQRLEQALTELGYMEDGPRLPRHYVTSSGSDDPAFTAAMMNGLRSLKGK